MPGHILLEGGAEFGGQMAAPDQAAMALAGGPEAGIGIIPAAAAPDHNHRRAGSNGQRWFESLGARHVSVIPLIDTQSASQPEVVEEVGAARLIYLLGGFPHYLGESLAGSRAWQAMLEAYQAGAVIAGSSAGAMVLCEYYYDPDSKNLFQGLGLIPKVCVLPHHNMFGRQWARPLGEQLPGITLIGIDEQTGMLDDAPGGEWRVYGAGAVTLYRDGSVHAFPAGKTFSLLSF